MCGAKLLNKHSVLFKANIDKEMNIKWTYLLRIFNAALATSVKVPKFSSNRHHASLG